MIAPARSTISKTSSRSDAANLAGKSSGGAPIHSETLGRDR